MTDDLTLLFTWSPLAARFISAIGSEDFPVALTAALRHLAPFDTLMATFYRGTARPQAVYHDLDEAQALVSTGFYESGPYLLDPFHIAMRNGVRPGVHLLFDLAPEGFVRSEYYRTFFRRIKLTDEIGLLVATGRPEEWLVLSLARGLQAARFTRQDAARLAAAFPLIAAASLKHWDGGAAGKASGLDDRLASFAAGRLSPRERDVVYMILNGRSTRAIAQATGISEGTVKVHRRHAYAKLSICSQAELFSLAARHLAGEAV
ncbi:MAG TPA: helix-turn-helix transcriptional regulator [Ensifer sp.]|nr:helix-turn-helix transcriptional regulator [Ensifer sp.]